mgnify:CR=1 FL=1
MSSLPLQPRIIPPCRMLWLSGDTLGASSLFSVALSTIRRAVCDEPETATTDMPADLFMGVIICARVLKMFAEFQEAQGDVDGARAKREEVAKLEVKFAFVTQ